MEFCEICTKSVPQGWDRGFTWNSEKEIVFFCSDECHDQWQKREYKAHRQDYLSLVSKKHKKNG